MAGRLIVELCMTQKKYADCTLDKNLILHISVPKSYKEQVYKTFPEHM